MTDTRAAEPERAASQQSALPEFGLPAYRDLIERLLGTGYRFRPVSALAEPVAAGERVAYLRHDVDFFLDGADMMAEVEAACGVRATYYVLLSGHYNPMQSANRRLLRRLIALGHEVGLHYDLTEYPSDAAAASAQLEREVAILSHAVGAPIRTLSMHQPFTGLPDPFREVDGLVHPHDPRLQAELRYVSDSCRAWRDDHLLDAFSPSPPRRLLLLTHPELWFDPSIDSRDEYLDRVVRPRGGRAFDRYCDTTVREIWRTHEGPRRHDERVNAPRLDRT